MSLDEIAVDVDRAVARAVARDLVALARFVRAHPRWAEAVIGQSFHLCVHSAGEWDERLAELDGNDDTVGDGEYLIANRSFGALLDLQLYMAVEQGGPAPEPFTWTGDNEADLTVFAKRADTFSWVVGAELDDDPTHRDPTCVEVWVHTAEPYRPVVVRPGDTIAADGTVIRGGGS